MQQQRPACQDGGTAGTPDSRNRSWRLEVGNCLGAQTWTTVLEVGSWRLEVGSSLWEQTWATLRLRSRQAFRPAAGARLGGPAVAGKQAQIVGTALGRLEEREDIAPTKYSDLRQRHYPRFVPAALRVLRVFSMPEAAHRLRAQGLSAKDSGEAE